MSIGHGKQHSLADSANHSDAAQWVDLQTIVSTGSANWDIASTTETINGNGTEVNPLTINPNISGTSLSLTDVTFTGAVSTLETATLSAAEYIIVDVDGIEKAIQLWDF